MKNDTTLQNDSWLGFIKLCQKEKSVTEWQEFFDLFITPAERKAVALRYTIIKELIKNEKTQRVIAKEAKTSIAKITRGSNYIKGISNKLKNFLEKNFNR